MKTTLENLFSLIPNTQTSLFITSGKSRIKIFEGTKARYDELCNPNGIDSSVMQMFKERVAEEIRVIGDTLYIQLIDPEDEIIAQRQRRMRR